MGIKKETEYITSDGERFTNLKEAEKHEKLITLPINAVDENGAPITSALDWDCVCYIKFKSESEFDKFIDSVVTRGCSIDGEYHTSGVYLLNDDGFLEQIPTVEEVQKIYSYFKD